QQRMAITYHDILYPPTGERLTRASFARLRRQGATVVIFQIPDSTVRQTLADSLVMVASDGISPHGHPRLAGTHARVLGRYVRDSVAAHPAPARGLARHGAPPARLAVARYLLVHAAPQVPEPHRARSPADPAQALDSPGQEHPHPGFQAARERDRHAHGVRGDQGPAARDRGGGNARSEEH